MKGIQQSVHKYRPKPPTPQFEDDLFRENTAYRAFYVKSQACVVKAVEGFNKQVLWECAD